MTIGRFIACVLNACTLTTDGYSRLAEACRPFEDEPRLGNPQTQMSLFDPD